MKEQELKKVILDDKDIIWINVMFKLMWIVALALFVSIPFKIDRLTQVCYWAFTGLNTLCFSLAVIKKQNYEKHNSMKDTKLLLLALVIVANFISFGFVGTFRKSADNLMGYLSYAGILFVMYYSNLIKIKKFELKYIGVINIFIAILFSVVSTMGFAYGRDEMWTKSLTLGFSNPNLTAMMIFINTTFLLVTRKSFKLRIVRLIITALIGYSIYMIYMTQSRASLAVTIVLIALTFAKRKKFKIRPFLSIICVLLPIAFLFGLTYMYENEVLKDLELLGKTIYSGREIYYTKILSTLESYEFGFLFGHFTEFQNTHNSALSLLRFFGIIGMVTYYIYVLYNILTFTRKSFDNKMSYICFIAILAIYIQSCAESTIILGGGVWIVAVLSLFAIAGNYKEGVAVDERTEDAEKKQNK